MSTLCPSGVLPARPDIEGLGTRIATYAQLLLAILTIAFTPSPTAAAWYSVWWALLVTSLGLQLAAVASRETITLFHALVVTWLAFPVFAMSWVYVFVKWRVKAMPSEVWLLTHLHGLLFTGFGLWIWSTAPTFGACPETNGSLQLVVLGKSVGPLGGIRIFVLVLYSIWALAFLIAGICAVLDAFPPTRGFISHLSEKLGFDAHVHRLSSLVLAPTASAQDQSTLLHNQSQNRSLPSHPNHPHHLRFKPSALFLVTLFNVLMLAVSIWSVEELLGRNIRGASREAENAWTFGQIAALILLAGPLFGVGRAVKALAWSAVEVRRGAEEVLPSPELNSDIDGYGTSRSPVRKRMSEKEKEKDMGVTYRVGEA